MTTIAFIVLAHQDPHHVARLTRLLLAAEGTVVIHYDLSSKPDEFEQLRRELGADAAKVLWPKRERVAWGQWSIVQATLNCLEAIAASQHTPDFVHLMSGSDYPIRPLSEFRAFLERNPNTEFIECVDMTAENWVTGGLTHERYEYRHFFNWKSHPDLFDRSWRLQQKLGLARRFPDSLRPHLGSQWWTLSWPAIEDILAVTQNSRITGFFETVWIPDEMFIQSVVATLRAGATKAPIVTLYQFTHKGVPVIYHNGHAEYLSRQPFFFARKISPWAVRLRDALDDYIHGARAVVEFEDADIGVRTDEYRQFIEERRAPTPGVRLLGYERDHWRGDLVHQEEPIVVLYGASHRELRMVAALLNKHTNVVCHGALFHPDRIEFVGDASSYGGYRDDDIALRDDRRTNFLHDIAGEVAAPNVAGFLAPWTMDENIRDRMQWSKFARHLVVHGNSLLAFEEYQERKRVAAKKKSPLDERQAPAKTQAAPEGLRAAADPLLATPQQFHAFEHAHWEYHNKLWKQLDNASAIRGEIDLMSPDWLDRLAYFLDDGLRGTGGEAGANTLLGANPRQPIPDDIAVLRRYASFISDADKRSAHIKALIRSRIVADRHFVVLAGACLDELQFVGRLLEQIGGFSVESVGSVAGAPVRDAASDPNPADGMIAALNAGDADDPIPVFLAPWNMAPATIELAAHEKAHTIIVRGNLFRAFEQVVQRRAQPGWDAMFDRRPDWIEARPRAHSPEAFMRSIELFYGKLQSTLTAFDVRFAGIDLVKGYWLTPLVDMVGRLTLTDRATLYRDGGEWAAGHAEELGSPALPRQIAMKIFRLIKDNVQRAGHLEMLKAGMAEPPLADAHPVEPNAPA